MKKWKKVCGAASVLLFTALLLFALLGLQAVIDGVILDGVVLAPETVATWGQNPGSTGTLTLRNFTFYTLQNAREFLYRGKTPRFVQVSNYLLQERSNFTDIRYSEDRSVIDYNYWLYFTGLEGSKDLQQKVRVLNLAPLGFWSQLENIALPSLAIQGFGGLFVEMNNTIKLQAIGQGVAGQYLANYSSFHNLCRTLQIGDALCQWLYTDPQYGLNDPNNYEVWVEFSYKNNSDAELVLYEYFGFKRAQLQAFDSHFERWCFSVDSILDNWYCAGPCQNYDLTILQLASSGLTANPPSGEAADSICLTPQKTLTQNISCQGFPELFSFYRYQFPKINSSAEFDGLSFSTATVRALYTPYSGTLLNVGNLSRLFGAGEAYDKEKSEENLLRLQAETHGETKSHAVVIWEYVKYFAYEFVLQSSSKGTKKIAGLGGVFSQAAYQSFTQFADWIMPELLAIVVAEKVPDCLAFVKEVVDGISEERAQLLCEGVDLQNYGNYYRLVEPCHNEYMVDRFQQQFQLSGYEMRQLCDPEQKSALTVLLEAHALLHQSYGCLNRTEEKRCTKYELAVKQFINSSISNGPITSKVKQYRPSLTAKHWNSELQEWEYRHFLSEVYGDSTIDKEPYSNYSKLTELLSFDGLFNGPLVQNLTLVQDAAFFEQLFYWKNKTLLMDYVRFVAIEVGFGGFTQDRTVSELLFGYEDPFLKTLKEMDPMLGGDPSIETKVALNEPNSTLAEAKDTPQSMYTGYSNPMITRNYKANLGQEIITYNRTYFDGYKVISDIVSPFKEAVALTGTDAIQEKPLSTSADEQYIYIDSLYRVGELAFDREVERFGFRALRYKIADRMLAASSDYPPNANFNQGIRGFMNLSFLGLPLFASKNHFLGAEPHWADLVETYDESGAHRQSANDYDETEVIMEPNSGATFVATLYLQTSVLLPQDALFTQPPRMLPVFTLYRSGNMTELVANDLLGDLKTALQAPKKLVLLSLFGVAFTAFLLACCGMRRAKRGEVSGSLLESSNEVRVEQQ